MIDKQARENIIKTWWEKKPASGKIRDVANVAATPFAGYAVGSMLKNIIQGNFKNTPNARARRALHLAMGLLILGRGASGAADLLTKKKK